MHIESQLYLIGSGQLGFDLTDSFDCNIFLFDTHDGYAVFDIGAGMGIEQILNVCRQDGLDPAQIKHLFLTHAHADHAGGAAHLRDGVLVTIHAAARTAEILATGDEAAVSLTDAKAGGMYPADYAYRACPVDHVMEPGQVVSIGDLSIELIATPGHSHDHHSYLVTTPDKRYLLGGDALFFGGRIILQNTYDCSVPQSIASIQRLRAFEFDALLPGHLNFSLRNGKRHVDAACAIIEQMGCPPSIL